MLVHRGFVALLSVCALCTSRAALGVTADAAAVPCVEEASQQGRDDLGQALSQLQAQYAEQSRALNIDPDDIRDPAKLQGVRERIEALRALIDERDQVLSRRQADETDRAEADQQEQADQVESARDCAPVATGDVRPDRGLSETHVSRYVALSVAQRASLVTLSEFLDFLEARRDSFSVVSKSVKFVDPADDAPFGELAARLMQVSQAEILATKAVEEL
jgi:hypothetical protein